MDVRKILSFIEDLNSDEFAFLKSYLSKNTKKLASLIMKGVLEENEEILMIKNRNGNSVAHWLALYSYKNNWNTKNKKILMALNKYGDSVAHFLAERASMTGWSTDDIDILCIKNDRGRSVAHVLAQEHRFWKPNHASILKLEDRFRQSVESILKLAGKI